MTKAYVTIKDLRITGGEMFREYEQYCEREISKLLLSEAADAVGVPPKLRPTVELAAKASGVSPDTYLAARKPVTLPRGDKTNAELREELRQLAARAEEEARRFRLHVGVDPARSEGDHTAAVVQQRIIGTTKTGASVHGLSGGTYSNDFTVKPITLEEVKQAMADFERDMTASGVDCRPMAPQPACPIVRTPGTVTHHGTIEIDSLGSVACVERAEERHGETRVAIVCRFDDLGAYYDALARALDGRTPCQLALRGKDRWVRIRAKDSAVFMPGDTAEIVLSLVDVTEPAKAPEPRDVCADCGGDLPEHPMLILTITADGQKRRVVCNACAMRGEPQCCPRCAEPNYKGGACTSCVARVQAAAAREDRRAREAPLVALVAAVPEWADPNAWRAAVLAAEEVATTRGLYVKANIAPGVFAFRYYDAHVRLREAMRPDGVTAGVFSEDAEAVSSAALVAYRRALAPAAKVQPERRACGPRIVCDNGED